MHDTAYELGRIFFEKFVGSKKNRVLDFGSLDINGSLRNFASPDTEYMGVDIVSGSSVDRVLTDPYKLDFQDGSFDVVVSTSCFEHDKFFWISFLEMCRVIKKDGWIYINCPSNGNYHPYPLDCWRFYPDAALAFVDWANYNNIKITLIESFTASKEKDIWNDNVMIFRKGEHSDYPGPYLNHYYPGTYNLRLNSNPAVLKFEATTEDFKLLHQERSTREALEKECNHLKSIVSSSN